MVRKSKLSIREQIAHMKNINGISFNIVSEEEAEDFLRNSTYYFKLKAYAKNFDKYQDGPNKGKYINLDFAFLKELSILDMHFRNKLMKLTLNIEHLLKTQLMKDVSENDQEDGYSITDMFLQQHQHIPEKINRLSQTSVCKDLIKKYKDNFAVWNIIEVLSFGDFINLYKMYYEKYPSSNSMVEYLWSVKFLRNAAAHNNCLLNSLRMPYSIDIKPNKKVNTYISKISGINPTMRKKKMKNPLIHDFIVCLYMLTFLACGSSVGQKTLFEIKELFEGRFLRNKHYFSRNNVIISYYCFTKTIVDHFHSKIYNKGTEQKH